jgi:hypothetical protein
LYVGQENATNDIEIHRKVREIRSETRHYRQHQVERCQLYWSCYDNETDTEAIPRDGVKESIKVHCPLLSLRSAVVYTSRSIRYGLTGLDIKDSEALVYSAATHGPNVRRTASRRNSALKNGKRRASRRRCCFDFPPPLLLLRRALRDHISTLLE